MKSIFPKAAVVMAMSLLVSCVTQESQVVMQQKEGYALTDDGAKISYELIGPSDAWRRCYLGREFLAVTNTDAGNVNADQAAIMQRSGAIPFESLFSDAPSPDSAGKLSWTRRCRNTACASGASPQPYRSWVSTLASVPSRGGE